jgi:hypothetical protein
VTRLLETGNALAAGAATRGWFVGDLAAWTAALGDAPNAPDTPRQSERVQVKWFVHPPGHVRPAWAERDAMWSLGVLVSGRMRFELRAPGEHASVVELREPGDYVMWHGPTYEHTWGTAEGCTILTVRWPAKWP